MLEVDEFRENGGKRVKIIKTKGGIIQKKDV